MMSNGAFPKHPEQCNILEAGLGTHIPGTPELELLTNEGSAPERINFDSSIWPSFPS